MPVDAFVDAFIVLSDADKLEWLEDEKDAVMEEVRAKSLQLLRPDETKPQVTLVEEWNINGQELDMGMSQVHEELRTVQA